MSVKNDLNDKKMIDFYNSKNNIMWNVKAMKDFMAFLINQSELWGFSKNLTSISKTLIFKRDENISIQNIILWVELCCVKLSTIIKFILIALYWNSFETSIVQIFSQKKRILVTFMKSETSV